MAADNWYDNLKYILFTHFKTKVLASVGDDFSNIYFTIEAENTEPTKLPTILFRELTPVEVGMTIDNSTVNAVSETIQVSVYSNERQDTQALMKHCVSAMKELRFNITGFPIYDTDHDIKSGFARFRRTIGASNSI